jgi:FlaA1/EpsC-like NDP-sugar epimerase
VTVLLMHAAKAAAPLGERAPWWIRGRTALSILTHLVLFTLSLLLAFLIRYDFTGFERWFWRLFAPLLIVALVIKGIAFGLARQYRSSWRYVGLPDCLAIFRASFLSTMVLFVGYYVALNCYRWVGGLAPDIDFLKPLQSVLLLDSGLTFVLVTAGRFGVRLYQEEFRPVSSRGAARLLIIGAREAGATILREILRMPVERYYVVGFLDDDPARQNSRILDAPVLGKTEDVRRVCEEHDVGEILIAMPEATRTEIRRVVELCRGTDVRFRTVPALADLIDGKVNVSQIRDVNVNDLLGRQPVTLDTEAIANFLHSKVVCVTGAGGSIGSEMCCQIAPYAPRRLVLVELAENNLFEIQRKLRSAFSGLDMVGYIADIRDRARVEEIMMRERPSVVCHAAAHKHVPLMETNPREAIKNNVFGTINVADGALKAGCQRFVNISTDKAVNPSSVLGCTKRLAELYVQNLQGRGETQFICVRFGNVLGSSGSVVPIFRDQIVEGGPVTVTHPEMTRYFMTIAEAAQLTLQAGSIGKGGEVLLLDMGEPVKIVDLARDMIVLSGLKPDEDIPIVYTGIRPGEKLHEELSLAKENAVPTSHQKIHVWKTPTLDVNTLNEGLRQLQRLAVHGSYSEIRAAFKRLMPEYNPAEWGRGPAGLEEEEPAPYPPQDLAASRANPH